jgi:DNA-binding transcriptional LysR family regulator
MDLRYLQYLKRVVEHGSFDAAAQVLGVSQPAISHGVRKLQAHFNMPLFQREGRRYLPTEHALQLVAEYTALAQRVDTLASGEPARPDPKVLRVGLTPSAAVVCGPVLHEVWCGVHPGRTLVLSSADEGRLLADLKGGAHDLVVSPRPRGQAAKGLVGQALYQLHPLVYGRKDHPLMPSQTLSALQDARWAVVQPSVSGPVDVLTEAFSVRRMPRPQIAVSCPDYASMLNLVACTDLLAVVPHPALLTGALHQPIVPLHLRETLPLYEMWVFHRARSRRAKAVAEALVQHQGKVTGAEAGTG